MKKTVVSIPKMDCPSEERLVRMALQGTSEISRIEFDLNQRIMIAIHSGTPERIVSALAPLNFGSKVISTAEHDGDVLDLDDEISPPSTNEEASVLKTLLAINFAMFVFEIIVGWIAQSTGLMADSLDMLADSLVYGISLYAVGKSLAEQGKSAMLSGYFQLALAFGALGEVTRRFFFGSEPSSVLMMIVSSIALAANVSCLLLLSRHRHGKVHMKASWIFSTNDVIANIGVIVAGAFVYFTKSALPDLVVGTLIAFVVLRGALAIIKLARQAQPKPESLNA